MSWPHLQVTLDPSQLEGLRELRLWHWNKLILERHLARKAWTEKASQYHTEKANFHIKQVCKLNDFFPEVGDTAERDESQRQ